MSVSLDVLFTHLAFVGFVAISVYVQNLTGFALALILLGLVGLTNVVPLADAINAVMMVMIVNSVLFLYRRRPLTIAPAIKPAVLASLIGTLAGIGLLTFLATHAVQALRGVLGIFIIACALLLWRAARPYQSESNAGFFTFVGALSGILGGVFSAAGPPLVYAVYRQPWSIKTIQESLVFSFGAGALLRFIVMAASGQISAQALILAAESIPVALLVTTLTANRNLPFSKVALKRAVCILLICAGGGMLL